jgi:hypothetical protein
MEMNYLCFLFAPKTSFPKIISRERNSINLQACQKDLNNPYTWEIVI